RIQEQGAQKVEDSIENEFRAIVNYGIIALIQLNLKEYTHIELRIEEAGKLYDDEVTAVKKLMLDKNHDYGEAWRDMSQESFVDMILTKLLRIKQIITNDGKTIISEG